MLIFSPLGEEFVSWNPITGCKHECRYCVTGDTLVLTPDLTWRPVADITPGEEVVGFTKWSRGIRLVRARVVAKVRHVKKRKVYRMVGRSGGARATEDHPWLIEERHRLLWASTRQVAERGYLLALSARPLGPATESLHFKRGGGGLTQDRSEGSRGVCAVSNILQTRWAHLPAERLHVFDRDNDSTLLDKGGVRLVEECVEVERDGYDHVYDLSTTTRTFLAGGFLSHNCWARRLALTRLRRHPHYAVHGFSPAFNERMVKRKFKPGETVFTVDMGDMWGSWVLRGWVLRVLDHVRRFPQTTFFFLTKNPARYLEFLDVMPENVILGATIETNRDEGYEHVSRAPKPSERIKAMEELEWPRKVVVVEPILDFDLEDFLEAIKRIQPETVYVGYDNYGNKLPEPPLSKTRRLVEILNKYTRVHAKSLRPAWFEVSKRRARR